MDDFPFVEACYNAIMVLTASDAKKLSGGDSAPDFRLPGVNGKTYSLADFSRSEGLLVIFMCNHCPYVKAKIADMNGLYEKFGARVVLIGINSNDPNYPGEGMEQMKKFAAERGLRFPYLFDEMQEVARAYGAACTPDPFLFDKKRKLVFHGRINDAVEPDDTPSEATMERTIETMLADGKIEKRFDPSIGCSIKWIER